MSEFNFEEALESKFQEAREQALAMESEPEPEQPEPEQEEQQEEPGEELEASEPERLRDAQGRFLPTFKDPEVQALLERFDGNVEEALRSAVHAQSLVGRQGNEVGELRQMMLAQQQQLMQLMQQQQQQPQIAPPPNIEEAMYENPGSIVHYALQAGDESLYEQAMDQWYEMQPRAAAAFERKLELSQLRNELSNELQPVAQATMADRTSRDLASAHRDLTGRYPDFQKVLESIAPGELDGFPQEVARQLQDGDLAGKRAALESIYRWVKAVRPPGETDEQRQAKRDAATVVTTPSRTARQDKVTGVEQFKKYLLEPEPTNWATDREQ